jgi:diguanylate cyclase (GGDEF)-like protein
MGDKLLKTAAQILQRSFRASDIIARIGGDEFAVLLPETSNVIVQECALRVRKEIEEFNQQDNSFGLSISIGSAVNDESPVDMQNLFKKADDAMYKQKLQQNSSSRSAVVQTLVKTMKIRDHVIEGHASRIQEYAQHMGQSLGLSEETDQRSRPTGSVP